jgi:hypothetical protein
VKPTAVRAKVEINSVNNSTISSQTKPLMSATPSKIHVQQQMILPQQLSSTLSNSTSQQQLQQLSVGQVTLPQAVPVAFAAVAKSSTSE